MHDLAAHANGNISVELTEGQIVNEKFNSLPTTLNILRGKTGSLAFSKDQKTELICGALNVPVKNGIITSQDQIALETDTLNFVLNGQIDLNNETVDLAVIPSVGQTRGMANQLLEIAQFIHLTGSWTNIETKSEPMKVADSLIKLATQKLTGQPQENKNTSSKGLCQKVLGKSLTQKANGAQKTQAKNGQKAVNNAPKAQQNLGQQIFQSLSQALTDQIAPEKK